MNVVRALVGVSDIKTNKQKIPKPKPAFWMECSRDREAPLETMGQSESLQSCWPMVTHAELAVQACLSQDMGEAVLPRLSKALFSPSEKSMFISLGLWESREESGV